MASWDVEKGQVLFPSATGHSGTALDCGSVFRRVPVGRGQFKRDIQEHLALLRPLRTTRTTMGRLVVFGPFCVSYKGSLPLYTATVWSTVVEVVV